MARIRTVKPELATHEGMFDAERETGLPLRFAWVMLFTVADREGRFKWLPRTLKSQVLPHDDLDFSRVLDAWLTRGFVRRYRVGDAWYGFIPTWRKHQVVNHRESPSELPSIDEADEVYGESNHELPNASATRDSRDDDASATRAGHARGEGEGKGREGERERKGNGREKSDTHASPRDTFALLTKLQAVYPPGTYTGVTWHQAERELAKLLDAGESEDLIVANTEAYRAQQEAIGNIGTKFIRSPKSFFGDGHWRGPFVIPEPPARKSASAADRVTWTPTE